MVQIISDIFKEETETDTHIQPGESDKLFEVIATHTRHVSDLFC